MDWNAIKERNPNAFNANKARQAQAETESEND